MPLRFQQKKIARIRPTERDYKNSQRLSAERAKDLELGLEVLEKNATTRERDRERESKTNRARDNTKHKGGDAMPANDKRTAFQGQILACTSGLC